MVQYHPTHMIQVLQNLIANALKYRSESGPRVLLRGKRLEGAWQISVSDNGLGFDMRYGEHVFRPFKRLQRTDDGGTGIGLAIRTCGVGAVTGLGTAFLPCAPAAPSSARTATTGAARSG